MERGAVGGGIGTGGLGTADTLVLSRVPKAGSPPRTIPTPSPTPTQRVPRCPPVHSQAAEKGGILSRWAKCIPQGLKPSVDSAGFMPGINPRPTARIRFSSACWGSGSPAGALREWKLLPVWRRPARNSIEFGKLARSRLIGIDSRDTHEGTGSSGYRLLGEQRVCRLSRNRGMAS
jgi:hypothetical protein